MDARTHQKILSIMYERGLSGQQAYRNIASELGKRGAAVAAANRARKNKQGMMGSKTRVHPDKKKEASKKAARQPVQGEFKFEQTVNYILKDLLF